VSSPETTLLERRIHRLGITALRAEVRRQARACGLGGRRLEDFLIAVNEIVANAVMHGGGTGRLCLWRDGDDLVCEVSDRGPGIDPQTRPVLPDARSLRGRGLWLAHALVDSVTISNRPDGAAVRLRMSCGASPPADPDGRPDS
jgi:anti-sigma regulatory factor (Ser/Thr protein kinase)